MIFTKCCRIIIERLDWTKFCCFLVNIGSTFVGNHIRQNTMNIYFKGRYSNKKKKTLTAEMQLVGTSELENLNYYTLLDNALKTNEYRNSIPLL